MRVTADRIVIRILHTVRRMGRSFENINFVPVKTIRRHNINFVLTADTETVSAVVMTTDGGGSRRRRYLCATVNDTSRLVYRFTRTVYATETCEGTKLRHYIGPPVTINIR